MRSRVRPSCVCDFCKLCTQRFVGGLSLSRSGLLHDSPSLTPAASKTNHGMAVLSKSCWNNIPSSPRKKTDYSSTTIPLNLSSAAACKVLFSTLCEIRDWAWEFDRLGICPGDSLSSLPTNCHRILLATISEIAGS